MEFYTRALEINKAGWRVLNCFQLKDKWNVNLQMFSEKGASTDYFSEHAIGNTPLEALEAAFVNAKTRYPNARPTAAAAAVTKKSTASKLTPAQEKKLVKAIDQLYFAIRMNRGTRSDNRDDDM